jgi:hypothetical protein
MGRLRDFGRDLANYFGFGEGSERAGESAPDDEPSLQTALWVLVPAALTFALHGPLGMDDDFAGRLTTVGLVAALAWACRLVLLVARRRHG